MHTKKNLDRSIATSITIAAANLVRFVRESGAPYAHEATAAVALHSTRIASCFLTGEIDGWRLNSSEHKEAEGELRGAVEDAVEAAHEVVGKTDGDTEVQLAAEQLEVLIELALIALLSPSPGKQTEPQRLSTKAQSEAAPS